MDTTRIICLMRAMTDAHCEYDSGVAVAHHWGKLTVEEVAWLKSAGIDTDALSSTIDDVSSAWSDLEDARDPLDNASIAIDEKLAEIREQEVGS